jgi:hypothetical protein
MMTNYSPELVESKNISGAIQYASKNSKTTPINPKI